MRHIASLVRRPLFFVLTGFTALIACGIFYDYGLSTAGDELPLLSTALKMIGDQTLRPAYEVFYHTALAAYLYLPFLVVWLGGAFVFHFHSLAALKEFVILDYFTLLPVVRVVTIGASLVSLYLVYRIAERLIQNRTVALYAVLFTATSFLFSYISHFARVWPIQIAVILFTTYLAILFYEREKNRLRDFALIGLAVGVSFGVHFIGLLAWVPFAVAIALKYGPRGFARGGFWLANALTLAVMGVTFWLNPSGFLNYAGFLVFLFDVTGTVPVPADYVAVPLGETLLYYGQVLMRWDPVLLLAGVGGAWLLFRRSPRAVALAGSFIVVYYGVISFIGMTPRYISPIVPFLAIFAGYGLYTVTKDLAPRLRILIVAVLFALLLIPPVALDRWMMRESTRQAAIAWAYENIPAGERIVLFDAFTPVNENKETFADLKAFTGSYTVKRAYLDSLESTLLPSPNYYVLTVPLFEEVPSELMEADYDYALVSFWSDTERQEQIEMLAEFAGLQTPEKVVGFGSVGNPVDVANDAASPILYLVKGGQNGPTIEVYKLR